MSCQGNILRRELTHLDVVLIGLLHLSVIHIVGRNRPRSLLLHDAVEGSRRHVHPRHITHVVEVDGLVAYRSQQCRIMENEGFIIFYQGDVVASQGCGMSTYGQSEEVISSLALLSTHFCRKKRQYNGKNDFFHLNTLILWQRYCFFEK